MGPWRFHIMELETIERNLLFFCQLGEELLRKDRWVGRSYKMPGQGIMMLRI